MQRMWSPWRSKYIGTFSKKSGRKKPGQSLFSKARKSKADLKNLIVWRGEHCFVIMNRYPYNSGHLLVCPYRHVATYDEATPEEVAEIGSLTQVAMRVLTETAQCHGFNIGMNQGRIAGAGIAEHLHQHIVPRWALDSNFFPIVA